ncbi:GGDEF domain-containing protein [Paenibacillus camerounensis]|uniref:GGDEF domain-containing protein n=1 Tax=Paenibacillus camerounensis TaxID=1243663 RepID=UPI000693B819|nr:GGDEF domain-containing protein [Paenibacillus camerounensis]
MDFQLDIGTLLYLFIFGNLFTGLLITFYRFHSPKDMASALFIGSKWVQVLFWSSMLLWDYLPHKLMIPLSNLLILLGGLLEITALMMMMDIFGRKAKLYFTVLTAVSVASFCIIALFFNQANLRVASASLSVLLFVLYPAVRLTAGKETPPLQRITGLVFYLTAGAMLGRFLVALFIDPEMGALSANVAQYLYYVGMFFMLVSGTAAFILLSNEHSYEKLKRIATYDSLTGILSRRAFLLEAELKLALAVKKEQSYSLLLLDLDHFKRINDTYGHDKGDTVLQEFAFTVENNLGNGDLFGRVGGEEFAAVLYGPDEADSSLKAEQLRRAVAEASQAGGHIEYTVSIGIITVLPDPRASVNMLLKLCDRALYQAKKEGRNRVVRYSFGD